MGVNEIASSTQAAAAVTTTAQQNQQTTQATAAAESQYKEPVDEVVISEKDYKYKPDPKEIQKLIEEANNKTESFRRLVESLVNKQASKSALAGGKEYNGTLSQLFANAEVDDATRAQAQEDISEDGYYGVKQTSERLLEFAKAISGGDPTKIETLRKAVQDGFKAAEKMWGDALPQISKDTYDATMKGFDEWAKAANGTGN